MNFQIHLFSYCPQMSRSKCFIGQPSFSHPTNNIKDLQTAQTGWQWRNFDIFIYASCAGRHVVGQENVHILQHLQSDQQSGARGKLFLNLTIQFYLNNVTNLHQLTSHSRTSCSITWRSYHDHRLLWCHFNLSIFLEHSKQWLAYEINQTELQVTQT